MMMMATPSFGLGKGGVASSPPPSPEPEELEPSSGWLEFDALALPGPDDRARRGKLARTRGDALSAQRSAAAARLEQLQPGPLLRDPLTSRGLFDHRFDADGLVEIPSDGVAHRVSLGVAQAAPRLRLRTVPREAPDVFREAELKNPFDAPLLAGPVDVYVEGSLLSTTANDRIDKGGTLTVGMGVEDRVRVARNARADETSAGVFGGSTSVLHSIDIELSSSLGREVTVEVIDRLPVTDNKEIEIVRGDETPASQEYAQAERGSPVRGGRLWRVLLPASGKVRIDWTYRLTFAAKDELVGGNRRE